ncbi:hypothetical protein G6Z92_18230 [Vibrio aestuarianus subsp. cardii]|uniref:hypothetical protein n=1 Tax=Vibrio aestuarianus TaxID=28171 RepID=UPI0015C57A69|nr:hypothetical protein [Vibrio aestuarianus]NGZ68862.1 hypothetical protein [Vibrio aestuarianus subsp. cardii]
MSNGGTYARKTVNISKTHTNIDQQLIQITEDRLKLILIEHTNYLNKKSEWVAPASILLTILVVFATTDFKQAIFSADTWHAIFFICGALSLGWLCKALYQLKVSKSVEDIIKRIKDEDS